MLDTHLPRKSRPSATLERATAAAHRQYVRDIVERTGVKPTPLAERIGVAASTLTRVYNAPDDSTATLHARTLSKLQAFSGIPAPIGEVSATTPATASGGGLREDAVPYHPTEADSVLANAVRLLIGERRAADAWTFRSRALECAGFMPGDVVIVDLGAIARAGDAVCAQVYDWRSGTAETVMRIYEPPYLVAATYDPSLRKPLVVDDDRVIIKGVILPHRLRPTAP
jgi:hypothetical protein